MFRTSGRGHCTPTASDRQPLRTRASPRSYTFRIGWQSAARRGADSTVPARHASASRTDPLSRRSRHPIEHIRRKRDAKILRVMCKIHRTIGHWRDPARHPPRADQAGPYLGQAAAFGGVKAVRVARVSEVHPGNRFGHRRCGPPGAAFGLTRATWTSAAALGRDPWAAMPSGAACPTRTDDLPLTRRLLYQLS